MSFFDFDFFEFFGNFSTFWLDFGKPWALQKLPKFIKNVFLNAFICQDAPKNLSPASETTFKGQQNAIWSLKTPFQASKTLLQYGKRIQNFCKCTFAAVLTLQCSKRIQNFCKCTFAAVLTKPSSMESTGGLQYLYVYIYIYI